MRAVVLVALASCWSVPALAQPARSPVAAGSPVEPLAPTAPPAEGPGSAPAAPGASAPPATPASSDASPPAAAPTSASITSAAPTPAPAAALPAPAPPAAPSVWDRVLELFHPYATFKPTIIVSSAAVESFSNPNESAITAAANPVLATQPDHARFTLQVAQTRLGLKLNEKGAVRGQVEIDFVDFAKASPTTTSLPRLRIAKVDWVPVEHFTLTVGQDWDLHAPVNPHGSNMVGANFLSGNTGFLRQQVKAIGEVGGFELAGAVGMQGPNLTAKDGAFELALVPTFALRVSWLVNGAGRVGVSGLATSLWLSPGTAAERHTLAGGVTAFADVTWGRTTLRGELTLGRNMSNLGLLALGFGGAKDLDEWGGFLSVRHAFTDVHALYAHAGLARVLNRSDVAPSYGYATATSAAALTGTGPGLRANGAVTLGYELRVHQHLAFMLEGFYVRSEHVLQAVDEARLSGTREALGAELATFVTF